MSAGVCILLLQQLELPPFYCTSACVLEVACSGFSCAVGRYDVSATYENRLFSNGISAP